MKKIITIYIFLFAIALHADITMKPYLMGVTKNSVYVLVESNSTTSPVVVEYKKSTSGTWSTCSTAVICTTSNGTYVYKIKLIELESGKLYDYKVSQNSSQPYDPADFFTAPEKGTSFKFAWEADMRNAVDKTPPIYGYVPHDNISTLIKNANPLFLLQGGDVCQYPNYSGYKDEFFRTNELNLISHVPFFWTPGPAHDFKPDDAEHTDWDVNYPAFSITPSGLDNAYYSFDYGDLHVLVLNHLIPFNVGSEQYDYAMTDLSTTTQKWKIVIGHIPAYSSGQNGENASMIAMTDSIFIPNGVDLVISGHDHNFQHNYKDGLHHIIIGSAGALLYPEAGNNWTDRTYIIERAKSYCYGIFEFNPNSLTMTIYNENGSQLGEQLTLTKPDNWTAYNDLAWGSGQLEPNLPVASKKYITRITSPNGRTDPLYTKYLISSGYLMDYTNGTFTGVKLTVTGGSFDGNSAGGQASHGQESPPGDATIFNGEISPRGAVSYDNNNLELRLSGMNPLKLYEVIFYADRGLNDWVRASKVKIDCGSSDDGGAFLNQSSNGTDENGDPLFSGATDDDTKLPANNINGYVARFTNISSGDDGIIKLIVSFAGTDAESRGKYASALMVKELNPVMNIPCPGTPTIEYYGKTYNTVLIGDQCWLKENLDVGTMISGSVQQANNNIIEKYCYDNNPANCNTYGGLYQWNEAMQYNIAARTQGICPSGWHIPTQWEFQTLAATVSYSSNALKAVGQGSGDGAGTNTSGFSALLAAYFENGNFYSLHDLTGFWSSREIAPTDAYLMYLPGLINDILFLDYRKKFEGWSVRCIKDVEVGLLPQAPTLKSPSNGATNLDVSPTLSWNESSTATIYRLQVSRSIQFTIVEYDQSNITSTRKLVSGLAASTTHYWRVNSTNEYGTSAWSTVWSFTSKQIPTCPGIPTVNYSGKTYNTVLIGSQCWLRENLDVGIRINGSQDLANNQTIEKYCIYNNPANCNTYGGLYTWDEMMQYVTTEGAQGICPNGWHIPSRTELQTLETFVEGGGNALKAVGQGSDVGAGTNISGFSGLLAGYRHGNGNFYSLEESGWFWSSTPYRRGAYDLQLISYQNSIVIQPLVEEYGMSVRCIKIKDEETSSIGWTAYNDLAYGEGQLGTNNNITIITSPTGGSGYPSSKELVKFSDGTSTGVTLTISGGSYDGEKQAGMGRATAVGNADIFNNIISPQGAISYNSENLLLTLSNMDKQKLYNVVFYSDRNAYIKFDGWERASLVTISGTDDGGSFTNQSSVGKDNEGKDLFSGSTDESTRLPSDNKNGYVARFININPGNDGSIKLTISANCEDPNAGNIGKYASALMVEELSDVGVQHTLTVNVNPSGSGTVTKSPDQPTYNEGAEVTLTANASAGWAFSGWSGDLTGSTNPVKIIMTANKVVTATFTQQPSTGWTAYNDLAYGEGQLSTKDKNITIITSPNGGSDYPSSKELVKYSDGTSTGVTLTISGGSYDGEKQAGMGRATAVGNADIFNNIISPQGAISYNSENLVLTLSNMDKQKLYNVVFYSDRNAYINYGGWERASLVTISGIDDGGSFTNQSSDGKDYKGNNLFDGAIDPSTRLPSDNKNGYVARFININPGNDGSIKLTISANCEDPNAGNIGKYASALMVQELSSTIMLKLVSPTVDVKLNSIILKWSMITNVNSYGFEVERQVCSQQSAVGKWNKIGFVEGHGNSNSPKEYSFTDQNLNSGKYSYRLKMIDNDGSFIYSNIVEAKVELPKEYTLSQNYPNPFNPTTRIDYQLPFDSKVTIELYGITGEKVATLTNVELAAGYYTAEINANMFNLASSVYICRMVAQDLSKLNTKEFVQIKKLMLIK